VNPENFLRIAYVSNILILVPVCWSLFSGSGVKSVFGGAVNESVGLRLLVGSLWSAILVASMAGLAIPRFFAPVLLIQIFYKALWLGLFVAPLLIAGNQKWPSGIAICFAAIVVTYPFLFWLGYVKAAS
jgi:hypothetical protein